MTLKDRKDNIYNKPSCRLLDLTKSNFGKISKKIKEQINQEMVKKIDVSKWRNPSNLINCFNNIGNKKDCAVIQFDTEKLVEILEEAISIVKSLTDTGDHKIRSVKDSRISLMFHNSVAWKKKLRQIALTSP